MREFGIDGSFLALDVRVGSDGDAFGDCAPARKRVGVETTMSAFLFFPFLSASWSKRG